MAMDAASHAHDLLQLNQRFLREEGLVVVAHRVRGHRGISLKVSGNANGARRE